MKTRTLFLASCLLFGGAITSCSNDDDDIGFPDVSERDKSFMITASHGNWAEVDLGKVADSLSTDSAVKMFGQMMVADHTTAQTELDGLGASWGIDLPDGPDTAHLAIKQQLLGTTGVMFDTAYIQGQIRDHQKTIALFQFAADSSDQPQLREYATKYLPKIRMHLAMADTIALRLQQ